MDNKYFAIAIPKKLNLKIDKKYINSIKTAQSEFYNYECIDINDKFMLKKIDDILFYLPNDKTCKNNINDIIKNLKPSKSNLNFDTVNLDKSTIFMIFFIFLAINLYFILGFINYKQEYNKLIQKKESLKKYNLPLTLIQLNSIYSTIKKINQTQQIIRKDLEFFSKTPLNKNEEYNKLSLNNGVYTVKIKTSRNMHSYFAKRFLIKSEEFNKREYKARLSHE